MTLVGFIKIRKWVNTERYNILQLYLNFYLKNTCSPIAPEGMLYFHMSKRKKWNH